MLINDKFVARNVTVLDFSNPQKIQLPDVYQPQSSIIKLSHTSIDIGSHCYTVRKVDKNGIASSITKNPQGINVIQVQLDSLVSQRFSLIKKAIEYAGEHAKKNSQSTVWAILKHVLTFLQFYFGQSDLDFSDSDNRTHYEEAARRYSAILKTDKTKLASNNHRLTTAVYRFAEFLFDGVDLIVFDYDIISHTNQNKNSTKPLLRDEIDLALALRTDIFNGVCDLLLNNKSLPFPLKVPEECGEINNTIWLGYSPWSGVSIFPRASDFERRQINEWFNRESGVLLTKSQFFELTNHLTEKRRQDRWGNIQRNLKTANSECTNLKESLATYAGLCFLELLLGMTGLNQQPALDLPWYGGYFIQKAKQGHKTIALLNTVDQVKAEAANAPDVYLRSIKNRKTYQPVDLTITNRFLPFFKQYLKLRHYILQGQDDARLFPFSSKKINRIRETLNKTFPKIPKLTAQNIRATVSDRILSSTNDPQVAAQILHNAPKTVIKHYAAGTQKGHIQGMGGFFNAVGNQVKLTRKAGKHEVPTAVGSCKNGGTNPDGLPGSPIESNCTQQEGCFFCKHFSIHTDEIDIRKLLSVLFYIQTSATRAQNTDFFNQTFGLVIKRIKDLLKQIEALSAKKKALISRIKYEVFEEDTLDDYWLNKLNRLDKLTGNY